MASLETGELPPSTNVVTQSRSWPSKNYSRKFELLIFSEAGKPIYTYTKREDAVTLMPLCSALFEYAKRNQGEALQSITTSDGLVINFCKRLPLVIIVVHDTESYLDPSLLIDQIEAQIISILTAKILRSVFEERPTFDLKRLLYGSEKLIDAITNLSAFSFEIDEPWVESFLALSSSVTRTHLSTNQLPVPNLLPESHHILIPVAVMPPSMRDTMHNIIKQEVSTHSKSIVFTLLFRSGTKDFEDHSPEPSDVVVEVDDLAPNPVDEHKNVDIFRLVSICNHHDRHKLKIADVHIILALLTGSDKQIRSAESLWLPVCLPKFNEDAFLHSYISYMNNFRLCLVMMSTDRDEFTNCQTSRYVIEERIGAYLSDTNQKNRFYHQVSPIVHPDLLELQDKMMSENLTGDELADLEQKAQTYNSKPEVYQARQLQFFWYQTDRQVIWWQRSGKYPSNCIIHYMSKKMLKSSLKHLWLKTDNATFLGWHVPTFQLYAQFDKTITVDEATKVIQRITNWIKKEEDKLSIKDYK